MIHIHVRENKTCTVVNDKAHWRELNGLTPEQAVVAKEMLEAEFKDGWNYAISKACALLEHEKKTEKA